MNNILSLLSLWFEGNFIYDFFIIYFNVFMNGYYSQPIQPLLDK